MRHLQFVRSNTFHWAFMVAAVLAAFILALFGFVYWQIDSYLIARSDRVVTSHIDVIGESFARAAAARPSRSD